MTDHNAHYRHLILEAVPPGCRRALDVGCGTGALTRQLAGRVPEVTGIDRDAGSIDAARSLGPKEIRYVLGDFLSTPFQPESYDFVAAVASLHHMPAQVALERMARLLAPGGTLAILGLARNGSLSDWLREPPAFVASRLVGATSRHGRTDATTYQAPLLWPPPDTYGGVRSIVRDCLPRAEFRRLLLWRYLILWRKPRT